MSCETDLKLTQRYKDSVDKIKSNKNLLWVFCDNHQNTQAEKYCQKDRVMLCAECAFASHTEHKGSVIEVKRSDVDNYMDKVMNRLV